jgi:PTH1 family peptidyl-tRNA hydrolase
MRVVVGLGNPGSKYAGTRHNIGFLVIDYLAASPRAGRFQSRFQGQVAEVMEGAEKVLLVKPETFMNLSGRCVREVLGFYQVPVESLLVVCDDINLPLGKLRVRARGSDGGQKGLRDIENHLGTGEYARLRVGIDSPGEADAADYVLSRFRPSEKPVIQEAVRNAGEAVVYWVGHGVEATMNKYNAGPERPKKAKSEE